MTQLKKTWKFIQYLAERSGIEDLLQSYPKWDIAMQSAVLQISALSEAWLQIKSSSGWSNTGL